MTSIPTTGMAAFDETPEVNGFQAFWGGLGRALANWQGLLVLYLALGLSALLLAVPLALFMIGPAHSAAMHEAAAGIPDWMVEDWFSQATRTSLESASRESPTSLPPMFSTAILVVGIILFLGPGLAWFPANALLGGLLLTFADAPLPFKWKRFAWGCWHWAGAFLLWGLIEFVLTLIIFFPLIFLAELASALAGWLGLIVIPILALILALWLALTEMTRVFAVTGNTRNVFRSFGQAVIFAFRHPLRLGVLYLLALAFLLALHALFRIGLFPRLPLAAWPLVLFAQQVFILLALFARASRYAGGVLLAKI